MTDTTNELQEQTMIMAPITIYIGDLAIGSIAESDGWFAYSWTGHELGVHSSALLATRAVREWFHMQSMRNVA